MINLIYLLLICLSTSCSISNHFESNKPIENSQIEDLNTLIDKKVTLKGKTFNMKLGACLVLENGKWIWMDGMDSWPEGYFKSENNTKNVVVTGILIERFDKPVFIQNDKNEYFSGIPVPEGTDLKKASHRYLVKDFEWKVIE